VCVCVCVCARACVRACVCVCVCVCIHVGNSNGYTIHELHLCLKSLSKISTIIWKICESSWWIIFPDGLSQTEISILLMKLKALKKQHLMISDAMQNAERNLQPTAFRYHSLML